MSGGVYILSNEPNVHSCYVTTKNEYKFVHTRYIIEDTTRAAWGQFFFKIEGNGLMDLPIWMGWGVGFLDWLN